MSSSAEFTTLNLCVLTVSDSRSLANDSSGDFLCEALKAQGHHLFDRALLPDNKYLLRAKVSSWIAEEKIDGVLINGGTGFTGRDSTPEAIKPLLDKEMPGFGEMFRVLSFDEIG
ncbi:MAG TPA: molybdopterin-binding protein, partial [Arenimonas sp.]|nr:molybdopterin-binding protein [Arenimonas sp.]